MVTDVIGDDDVTCETNGAAGVFASEDVADGITSSADTSAFDADRRQRRQLRDRHRRRPPAPTSHRADLTATAHGVNKVYDGDGIAAVTFTDDHVSGDTYTYAYTANFSDKNVGTSKPVTVTAISISGGDSANYNLLTTATTTAADITKKDLHVTAHGVNRGYNGVKAATVTFTDDRVRGDDLTYSYSAEFNNRNAGTGKPVSVTRSRFRAAPTPATTISSTPRRQRPPMWRRKR